jgi:hypothetical protein
MRLVIAALCYSLIGCLPTLTRLQMNLRVGATTQAEELETFGAPNITTIDGAGREVWTYTRNATITQSSADSQ